jgi:hypothetical protein
MIVEIRLPDGVKDWCIIELQGVVETRDNSAHFDGLAMGNLTFNAAVMQAARCDFRLVTFLNRREIRY